MRCAIRACLLGTCILIAIIYFAVNEANSKTTETWDENDDLTRRLLEGGVDSVDAKSISIENAPSISVAIVIIISLVSVSLLITGIIIVAITIDPSSSDDESDIEWNSPTRSPSPPGSTYDDDEQAQTPKIYYSQQVTNEL